MSTFGADDRINAGDLDRFIDILAPDPNGGPWGSPVGGPNLYARCYASYEAMRYVHTAGGGSEITQSTDVFTIRYRDDIHAGMSVRWKTSLYEIDRISQVGRRAGIRLHCRMVR